MQNKINKILEFIKLESFSGLLLFIATLIGLVLANSSYQPLYQNLFANHAVNAVINDGLMAIFFLLVGCEIRREMTSGELNSKNKILLPLIAAIFGMIVPAGIYILFNHAHPPYISGWAIPCATDIAFALGVLALLGKRIPVALKALLMAIAIFDDIGAIIIIALFYSQQLVKLYIVFSILLVFLLVLLNLFSVKNKIIYSVLGLLLWFVVFKSGIHATISGVLFAFLLPKDSVQEYERFFHPMTAYMILPLFAVANSGVSFSNFSLSDLKSGLFLGIFFGLFLGKQIGVYAAIYLSEKCGLTKLSSESSQISHLMLYGMSILCGIGFTMSLFIGGLAFDHASQDLINTLRVGVMLGSLVSGVVGVGLLLLTTKVNQ